jgi:hypothetical protein
MFDENITVKNSVYQFLFFTCILFALHACQKPAEEVSLTILFRAKFNNEDLQLKREYTDSKGYKYKLDGLKFFLSNISLVKEDNSEVKVSDLICVDFENASTLQLHLKNFEKGRYKKIKFGIGLTPEQNNVLPDDAPAGDPRQIYSLMYWSWLKYIFVKMDGRSDIDGSGNFQNLLIYHVGTDELYRTAEVDKKFEISEKQEKKMAIVLNFLSIFYQPNSEIDITDYEQSYTHSDKTNLKNYNTAIKFADNFSKAFTAEEK